MTVRPAQAVALFCDHCLREIRIGRTVVFGQVGTFLGFDSSDGAPLMRANPRGETRQYHRDCLVAASLDNEAIMARGD